MLKRERLQDLQRALDVSYGQVETIVYDAKTATLADVLDEIRSFGLLAQYKIVVVDDADRFVSAHRQALERYAQSPVDQATLVLRCSRWNRGKLDKLIENVGCLIRCESPSRSEAQAWLVRRAKNEYQRQLSTPCAAMLVERLGVDLMRLDGELSKLCLAVAPAQPVTLEIVKQVVGRSSDEQAWVVQEAVLAYLAGKVGGGDRCRQLMEKIHDVVEISGQADVLVSYFVADLLRKLYLAVMMRHQGLSEPQIAKQLRFFGPREHALRNAMRWLTPEKTRHWFDEVVRRDIRSKSGLGDCLQNMECLCVHLADAVKGGDAKR